MNQTARKVDQAKTGNWRPGEKVPKTGTYKCIMCGPGGAVMHALNLATGLAGIKPAGLAASQPASTKFFREGELFTKCPNCSAIAADARTSSDMTGWDFVSEEQAKSEPVAPTDPLHPSGAEQPPWGANRPGIAGWVVLAVFGMGMVGFPCCAAFSYLLFGNVDPRDPRYDTIMSVTGLTAMVLMALAGIVVGFICRARRRRYDASHPLPALRPGNGTAIDGDMQISRSPAFTVISGSIESWVEELNKTDAEFGEMFYQCPNCRYSIRINDIGKMMLKTGVQTFRSQFGERKCKKCGHLFVACDNTKKGHCPDFDYATDTQR
jgi:hypothetical protein